MAIKVTCKCGRSLNAPDEAVGKHGKCPACGNRLLIAAPEEPVLLTEVVEDMPLGFSLDLGRVKCTYSELQFSFHVDRNRCAYIEVIGTSSHGRSTEVVILRLDDERYEQLIHAMRAAEETVRKYRNSGPARRMVEVFGNRP